MKKLIYLFVAALVALAVYFFFFTKQERKASVVRENLAKMHIGMSVTEVKKLLAEPDTTYYTVDAKDGSGMQVFQYYQGFGAPDVLRVLIKKDTVVDVNTNN
jgi:hypothetical protein